MKTTNKRLSTSKLKIVNQKTNEKKYKMITTIWKSFDTIVFITTTSSSIVLSVRGIELIAIPKSAARACGLSISNELISEKVSAKTIENKKTIWKRPTNNCIFW